MKTYQICEFDGDTWDCMDDAIKAESAAEALQIAASIPAEAKSWPTMPSLHPGALEAAELRDPDRPRHLWVADETEDDE